MKTVAIFTYFAVMAVIAVAVWSDAAGMYFSHCQDFSDLTYRAGCR